MQKVKAVVELENIRQNAEVFTALAGKPLCAVVKANAYGHGGAEVASALSGVASMFAVALLEEGIELRYASCNKDILVFTPPLDEEESYLFCLHELIATIPDFKTAKLLSAVCRKYKTTIRVHLKVNVGMNRYGMNGSMLGKVCTFLREMPWVRVEGIYGHLSANTPLEAEAERLRFLRMESIAKRYFPNLIAHLGATYGALLGDKYAFDMIRVGLGLYGYLPRTTLSETLSISLKKAMTVYAKRVFSRRYAFGNAGYGKGEVERGEYLSVCRFGYADGFLRKKENGVKGYEKQVNSLCMDVSLRRERGEQGKWIPIMTDADEVARVTDTISYEVLCAVTRRAEFIYK